MPLGTRFRFRIGDEPPASPAADDEGGLPAAPESLERDRRADERDGDSGEERQLGGPPEETGGGIERSAEETLDRPGETGEQGVLAAPAGLRCARYRGAAALPSSTSSTRRFCALPAAVALVATGRVSP